MAKKIKVFVSYSRHDEEVEKIQAFTSWLESLATSRHQAELEFVTDAQLKSADDVNQFERSLRLYPAVLVIGTKTYKSKVIAGEFGVSREFKIIVQNMLDRKIDVFTAITEGTLKDVLPNELHGPLARTFVGIVHDRHSNTIPDQIRTIHYSEAVKLVDDILENASEHRADEVDLEQVEEEIRRKLFFEQKHEALATGMTPEIVERIFVKTTSFFAAKDRNAFLFVGRKGSGKSFLTEYFANSYRRKNQINIGLHLRKYDLTYVYSLKSGGSLKDDFGKHFPQSDLMEGAWTLCYVASAIVGLLVEVLNGKIEYPVHKMESMAALAETTDCLRKDGVRYSIDYLGLINWCISKAFHVVDVLIKNLPSGADYHATVLSAVHSTEAGRLVPAVLGSPSIREFAKASETLRPNFLITIDGFDTKFDRFREQTRIFVHSEELDNQRAQFEIDWMRGLLETSLSVNDHSIKESLPFLKNCNFRQLITLPKDRFFEVRHFDRDGYRFRNKVEDIKWSAPELMLVLRKRLECYFTRRTEKVENGKSRPVESLFEESFSWIKRFPMRLNFSFNDENIDIDIFSYILRHTFWRPRDVIHHISKIITHCEVSARSGRPIDIVRARKIIGEACEAIIDEEFLKEFSSIFPKIGEAIRLFRNGEMEYDYSSVHSKISRSSFVLSSGESLETTDAKVKFLFEIGFLGLVLPEKIRDRVASVSRECFSFASKLDLDRDLDVNERHSCRYVVHPIFAEYLSLNTSDVPFLMNYSAGGLVAYEY